MKHLCPTMVQPHRQHAYAQGERIFLLPCPCGLTLDQAFRLMCELRDLLPALSMSEPKRLAKAIALARDAGNMALVDMLERTLVELTTPAPVSVQKHECPTA